jgi:hypothetical protein
MKPDMETNVYVFQTSVKSTEEIQFMKVEIELLPGIRRWNFDLDDPDFRVFRIEAEKNISNTVISLFNRFNFRCLELIPDDCD